MSSCTRTDSKQWNCFAGFDGCVCVWDVRIGASTTPHLMHHWEAHPGSEILSILHDPMKNVIITAGNDTVIKVKACDHGNWCHSCRVPVFVKLVM